MNAGYDVVRERKKPARGLPQSANIGPWVPHKLSMKSKPSTSAQESVESLLSVETMTALNSATKGRAGAASKQSFMKSAVPVAVHASTRHNHAELVHPNVIINAVVGKIVVTLRLTTCATRIANPALLARSWLRSSVYVESEP